MIAVWVVGSVLAGICIGVYFYELGWSDGYKFAYRHGERLKGK